jgi:hypothetical protein
MTTGFSARDKRERTRACTIPRGFQGAIIFSILPDFEAILLRSVQLVILSAFLLYSVIGAGAAQIPEASQPQIPGAQQRERDDPWTAQQKHNMEKKQNLQRQEDLKKDTEKLLELATELKQYVDKSNENTLSMDVIKKADQIEKLAKSVKDKMKGNN